MSLPVSTTVIQDCKWCALQLRQVITMKVNCFVFRSKYTNGSKLNTFSETKQTSNVQMFGKSTFYTRQTEIEKMYFKWIPYIDKEKWTSWHISHSPTILARSTQSTERQADPLTHFSHCFQVKGIFSDRLLLGKRQIFWNCAHCWQAFVCFDFCFVFFPLNTVNNNWFRFVACLNGAS